MGQITQQFGDLMITLVRRGTSLEAELDALDNGVDSGLTLFQVEPRQLAAYFRKAAEWLDAQANAPELREDDRINKQEVAEFIKALKYPKFASYVVGQLQKKYYLSKEEAVALWSELR